MPLRARFELGGAVAAEDVPLRRGTAVAVADALELLSSFVRDASTELSRTSLSSMCKEDVSSTHRSPAADPH